MNGDEVIDLFKKLGCEVRIQATGHPRYERGFVTQNGISIARITFLDRAFDHVKWYWRCYGELLPADFVIFQWSYLWRSGEVLSEADYVDLIAQAEDLRAQDLKKKREWRRVNPSIKQRKKLQGSSIRGLINQLISEKYRKKEKR